MKHRAVPISQDCNCRAWCQHRRLTATRARAGRTVPFWKVGTQHRLLDKMRLIVPHDHASSGKIVEPFQIGHLAPIASNTRWMQHFVHGLSTWSVSLGQIPSCDKRIVGRPPAITARAMSGSESHGFIEEKQLCPVAPGHDGPLAALPIERAANPGMMRPTGCPQRLVIAMNDPAIARQRATGRDRGNLASRQNTVL